KQASSSASLLLSRPSNRSDAGPSIAPSSPPVSGSRSPERHVARILPNAFEKHVLYVECDRSGFRRIDREETPRQALPCMLLLFQADRVLVRNVASDAPIGVYLVDDQTIVDERIVGSPIFDIGDVECRPQLFGASVREDSVALVASDLVGEKVVVAKFDEP